MTKNDLAKIIERAHGFTRREAVAIIDAVLETIIRAVAKGQKVELRGLGSFGIKEKRGRAARNPRTGEKLNVKPKVVARFKPSKEFKKLL